MNRCSVTGCPQVADTRLRLENPDYGMDIPVCYGHLELAHAMIADMKDTTSPATVMSDERDPYFPMHEAGRR